RHGLLPQFLSAARDHGQGALPGRDRHSLPAVRRASGVSATGLALGLIMKNFLVGLTAVAVVSDTMLIPFYPRFFDVAFGIGDPRHVGYYLAAVCLTVMLGFPAWAHVARRIDTLRLLVYTQLAAGVLSVVCAWAPSLAVFWLVSLAMVAFKASYLLIYPLIMSREPPRRH